MSENWTVTCPMNRNHKAYRTRGPKPGNPLITIDIVQCNKCGYHDAKEYKRLDIGGLK